MSYTIQNIQGIWSKGFAEFGYDPSLWRKDIFGSWMGWHFYGNRNSEFGWEVDHIIPVDSGGGEELSNLRPLNWRNNVAKQNKPL